MEKWFRVRTAQGEVIAQMRSIRKADDHNEWNKRIWAFTDGWTHPDHRRSGHFRTLWKERMDWTLEQNPRIIEGWCNADNEQFFVDAGFKCVMTAGDEKLMQLKLSPVAFPETSH
jgi:hypothetical protein